MQSGFNLLSAVLLVSALISLPGKSFALTGFSGAALTPANQTVCSGTQMNITFQPSTCTIAGVGPDWSATYFIDSSSDAGATWYTPTGTTTGTIGFPTTSLTYTSPVFTATTCRTIYYRVRLTGITANCSGPGTTFTSFTVSSNVCPQPAPITGPSSVCIGNTIALNDPTSGGTYSSSPGTGSASVTATTGVVTGSTSGTATISYSLSGGCASTHIVTVYPAAPAISGPASLCTSSTANYNTGVVVPGTWLSSNTAVANIGSGTGILNSGTTTGTTTITFTETATSCFSTYVVSVNPTPQPIGCNTPVCAGSTMTLCDATIGGSWGGGSLAIATVNGSTGEVTGIAAGTVPITYFTGLGCFVTTIVTVNAQPAPINGTTAICVGGTTTLSTTSTGGIWSSDNIPVAPVSSTGVVSGNSPGTATISYSFPFCRSIKIINVSAIAPVILGPSSVCIGSTITLTEASGPSVGTPWSSTNTAVADIDPSTGVVTPHTAGTTTISFAVGTGCVASTVITVNPTPTPSAGIGALCPGQTATITNFASGGTWSSSNTIVATIGSTTGNLIAIAGGTTNISYVLPTGCYTFSVETVNPAPAPITGVPSTCVGFSTTLHTTSTGGTWNITSTPAGAATVSPAGVVSGLAAGTATVSYTFSTGCASSIIVTIDAFATPIVGPFTVCEGPLNTITLTDANAGGTWSSSDPTKAPVSLGSGVVTGLAVGTATITYTQASGCAATAVVTVNPVPQNITGTLYLCQGATTTLADPSGGGTWSSSTPAVGTIGNTTGTVSGITGGTTIITYTLPAGCYTLATVTVYALPTISGVPLVCVGTSVALTGSPAGGIWTSNIPLIASVGSLSGVVTGVQTGTSTITYAMATTCLTTIVATVQTMPLATTGADTVCVGLTTPLDNATPGGGTWSSSNTFVATVDAAGVVTGMHAGSATITFTSSVTGCYVTFLIRVNPLPAPIAGPHEVCVNATITLTDASGPGTWSTSSPYATVNSATGVVTGAAAGVATITFTLPTTCQITYDVTVNPLPAAIAGPNTVCMGDTIILASGTPGGAWSIAPTSVATISSTGVVTPVSPGTATVSYTISPTGCAATSVITVNPLPAPITGELNICLHDSTVLHDATPGGTWSTENIYIAVILPDSGLLGTVTAGTTHVTYTLPTGCYVTTIETVNPTPEPIIGSLSICVGGHTTLSDITTGGSWSSSDMGVAIIGTDDGFVTGLVPGTSYITYTLPSSCPRVAILTVNANPASITGITRVCLGNTSTLGDSSPGGTWSSSNTGVAIAILTSGVVFSTGVGTTVISYSYPTGCYASVVFTVDPVPTASTIVSSTGSFTFCQGTSITLSNPAYPGGSWSIVPATAVAAVVGGGTIQGNGPGTARVTYTLPTGCDTFITVTVVALPTAIAGPSAVCGGTTNTFTSTPTGGTWTSSLPAVLSINATTGIAVAANIGFPAATVIITYTAPSTNCQVTKIVTVNPNPGTIVGTNAICKGATAILSSATLNGNWTSSNISIVTVTAIAPDHHNALITGVNSGVDTIFYTLATGCFTSFVVTVDPLPGPIAGPHTVCVNDSITLTDPIGAGIWHSSNVAIAKVDTVTGRVYGITAGNVIITYTINNHTPCSVFYTVTVNPLPPVIYGPADVCVGSTITLHDTTATGANTAGSWTSSDVSIATVGTNGVVTGVGAGTVTIRFTLPVTGCSRIVVVTVHPLPVVSIVGYPTIMCKYASTNLLVTGAGAGGSYSWSPATGLSCTNCPNPTANPTITTTYTVTGTTIFGCTDTAVVTVIVDSALNGITITGQDSVCRGGCTQLIATGRAGTYFNWKPSANLSCTICDTVIACPPETATYNAVAIDSMGCRDSLFITITVIPLPRIKVTPSPAIVCRGSFTQLHAVDSNNGPSTKYEWFPNIFISDYHSADPYVSDTFNLIYRVTGTTPFGCTDSIKVPVTVLDSAFNTINKDTTICLGQSAQLYATSFNPDGSRSDYLWLNDYAMTDRLIPNPVVTPSVTTTYPLLITPNVCFPDTLYTTVKVVDLPSITITPNSATVAAGTPVTLVASVTDLVISSYGWMPSSTLSCLDCYTTVATPITTTTYTFTATSNYGCSATREVTVHVFCESSEVFIPNTFTPNGDGMNDRFFISGKGISEITKFQVFNRWGELVYQQKNIMPNDQSVGWDGQYKGVVLEPDVFIYIIEATCNLGEHFTYKGDISIVR